MSPIITITGKRRARRIPSDLLAAGVTTSEQPTLRLDIDLRLAYFQSLELWVHYAISIKPTEHTFAYRPKEW
jgi:hypothetical protein